MDITELKYNNQNLKSDKWPQQKSKNDRTESLNFRSNPQNLSKIDGKKLTQSQRPVEQ